MTYASSAFGQLRYIAESTRGVTPGAGNGVNLRMTGPTMKASVSTVKSEEIRADRLSTGSTRTDMNIDGGFNFEMSCREYDPFLCNLLGQSGFTHYGTSGLGTTFSATTAAGSITAAVAPTTTSAFTNLTTGSWFKLVPPAGASQSIKDYFADRWFKVGSTTSTVITLDASTQISGAGLGITAVAGYAVSQSTIVNGSTFNSFTLEYAMTDIAQFLPFTGMQVGSMDLSLDVGAFVKGSFGFLGQGHSGMVGATTLPGSPVASQTLEVLNSVADVGAIYENGASILSSTASFIKGVKLNINNNLRGQKAIGVFGNAGVGMGELALSGTLDVYVENSTYYNKWLNGTNTSLALGVSDSAGNGYMLEFDKVTFKDAGLNPGGRTDDVMLSLPFDAFYSATTGRGVRITRAVAA
jgi:hypothetical protein